MSSIIIKYLQYSNCFTLNYVGESQNNYQFSSEPPMNKICDNYYENQFSVEYCNINNPLIVDKVRKLECINYVENMEKICIICQDALEKNDKIIKLHCNHNFHKLCVITWFKYKDTCPYCNYKI